MDQSVTPNAFAHEALSMQQPLNLSEERWENISWDPFVLVPTGAHADAPRSLKTRDGIEDRLRAAAFAEIQAREAFLWASVHFEDTPENLRGAWRSLAFAEDKHLHWLLNRMSELGMDVKARRVSDFLWHSLRSCKTARDFAIYMASAEERGKRAGERFHQALITMDPITAEIFRKIAEEEITHIELALRFYPDAQLGAAVGPPVAKPPRVEQGSTRGPEV